MSDNSVEKFTVVSHGSFRELGYEPVIHPDGYIYYTKTAVGSNSATTDDAVNEVEVGNEILEEDVIEDTIDQSFTHEDDSVCVTSLAPPIHQWNLQLKYVGYALCSYKRCNFMAFTEAGMREHYAACDGNPIHEDSACKACKRRCVESERKAHLAMCSTRKKKTLRKWAETRIPMISNPDSILKSNNEPGSLIIQPTPQIPKGTYRKRRSYTSAHIIAWCQKLEKFHYIRCHFQNCTFLAMSVDDMLVHFGTCCGDSSFAQFQCLHCKGSVTSQEVLNYHMKKSHGKGLSSLESSRKEIPFNQNGINQPTLDESQNLEGFKKTMINFFDKNGFALCSKCSLICFTTTECCIHFSKCTGDVSLLKFICSFCSGLTLNKNDLDRHIQTCHKNNLPLESEQSGPVVFYYKENGRLVQANQEPSEILDPELVDEQEIESEQSVHPKSEVKCEFTCDMATSVLSNCVESVAAEDNSLVSPDNNPSEPIQENEEMSNTSSQNIQIVPVEEVASEPQTPPSNRRITRRSILENQEPTKEPNRCKRQTRPAVKKQETNEERQPKRSNRSSKMIQSTSENSLSDRQGKDSQNISEDELPVEKPRYNKKKKRKMNSDLSDDEPLATILTKQPETEETSNVCAKCKESVKRAAWKFHNAKKHAGLSWYEGQEPIDINALDKNDALAILRSAFKITSSAVCESCQVTKKSFLGFYSHITRCGKSAEELEKGMATCPKCGNKVLPVSMYAHMRIHDNEDEVPKLVDDVPSGRKRRSAIRALTNLQEVLQGTAKPYAFYQKGDEALDILFLNSEVCPRPNCNEALPANQNAAIDHFLNCSAIPNEYFQCLSCPTFFIDETDAKNHGHDEGDDYKRSEDEDAEEEEEEEFGGLESESELSSSRSYPDNSLACYKQCSKSFFQRLNNSSNRFRGEFSQMSFDLELAAQRAMLEKLEPFPEFHTQSLDWKLLRSSNAKCYFPPLHESLPMKYGNEKELKKYEVFSTCGSKDFDAFFVGGVVQNLAWCPIKINREPTTRQLLALSVSSDVDDYPSILTTRTKSTLLQVWDVGDLAHEREDEMKPRLLLGLALDFGELWDLTWSPMDTYAPPDNNHLERLGLIAAAFNDGTVRIYSIASVESTNCLPIYKVAPRATLITQSPSEEIQETGCLKVSWGTGGVICAGYKSGLVSLWNLNQVSRRIAHSDNTFSLYPYQSFYAHSTPITGLALSPKNSSYLATSGGDRCMKHWDLRNPTVPTRKEGLNILQKFYWMHNWPGLYYLQSSYTLALDFPQRVRILNSNSTIKDLSFSEWLCTTAVSNESGEIILRYNTDPFHNDRYRKWSRAAGLTVVATKCVHNSKEMFTCYSEVEKSGSGISFSDIPINSAVKMSDPPHPAAFSVGMAEKVAFNPNYRCFDRLAIGYRSGVVRILRLKQWEKVIDEQMKIADNET